MTRAARKGRKDCCRLRGIRRKGRGNSSNSSRQREKGGQARAHSRVTSAAAGLCRGLRSGAISNAAGAPMRGAI